MTDRVHHHPKLRPALLTDVAAILAIEKLSFDSEGERFTEKRVRSLISNPRAAVTVAEVEGSVLGWAAGFNSLRGSRPWGRIYAVAVHPEGRGRKLGAELLLHLMHLLSQKGPGPIYLEVRPDNSAAIRLYEKFGFVLCDTLNDFYGAGQSALRMVRMG